MMPTTESEHSRRIREMLAHWARPADLVQFAVERHGFGDSNGGFGVTYPGDLDESDRAPGGCIRDGFVEIYGHWGTPHGREHQGLESEYLASLADYLQGRGLIREAEAVKRIR